MKTRILFDNYPTLNLKVLCETTNVCYQYALKLSKTPVKGQAYNPEETNYDELDKLFERKNIDLSTYNWDAITENIKVKVPATPIESFCVGEGIRLRGVEYGTIVYINRDIDTDQVLEVVFLDHSKGKCRVMSADTFLHQSPRIVHDLADIVMEESAAASRAVEEGTL